MVGCEQGEVMGRTSKLVSDREVHAATRLVDALSNLVDRVGIAFVVPVAIVWTVKSLGNAETQDEFIREVLFGEVTGGRSLAIFFACMIVMALFGLDSVIRRRLRQGGEFTRTLKENERWQVRVLRLEHSHTDSDEGVP